MLVQGLRWMAALHDHGLSGILADDMGLGKTVQIIALVTYLVESRGNQGPYLIAAPASVLPNWAAEFERWAPDLKVSE
jgi:SNF2 family DNA or RNA helicase